MFISIFFGKYKEAVAFASSEQEIIHGFRDLVTVCKARGCY